MVIDKRWWSRKGRAALKQSVATAMQQGDGLLMILDAGQKVYVIIANAWMCPVTGLSYSASLHRITSRSTLRRGPARVYEDWGMSIWLMWTRWFRPFAFMVIVWRSCGPRWNTRECDDILAVQALLERYEATLKTPVSELPDDAINEILYGCDERQWKSRAPDSCYFRLLYFIRGASWNIFRWCGRKEVSATAQKWAGTVCQDGCVSRIVKEHVWIKKSCFHSRQEYLWIGHDGHQWVSWLGVPRRRLSGRQATPIATEILKEIRTRLLKFLLDGDWIICRWNRSSVTLSGGESQHIRLATDWFSAGECVVYSGWTQYRTASAWQYPVD